MLIQAHEARQIVQDSEATTERLLKYISTNIQKQAEAGLNFLVLEELPYENMSEIFKLSAFGKTSAKYEALADRIKCKLIAAGYQVGLARREIEVGVGLGAITDPVIESVVQIIVKW